MKTLEETSDEACPAQIQDYTRQVCRDIIWPDSDSSDQAEVWNNVKHGPISTITAFYGM